MYNLLEYSKNYKKTTGSVWNYYRDEPSDHLSSDSESFKYKNNITGNSIPIPIQFQILIMMQIKLVKMKLKLLFH